MNTSPGDEITRVLDEMRAYPSQRKGLDRLFSLVQAELRSMAGDLMQQERPSHTLQPTALVNEAYLRLVRSPNVDWQNRAHFFGAAARAMRQILVDHARARATEKRGGELERIPLEESLHVQGRNDVDVIFLDDLLNRLAELDERMARVVELRVFAGLTGKETAAALGVSRQTVHEDWRVATLWLRKQMAETSDP